MARQDLTQARLAGIGLTYSVAFNGVDQNAQSAADMEITGSQAFSIGGWVKTREFISSNAKGIFGAGSVPAFTNGYGPLVTVNSAGGFAIANRVNGPFFDTAPTCLYRLQVGEWTHVMLTYAGGSNGAQKIYINGNLVHSDTITGIMQTGKFSIGGTYLAALGITVYMSTVYGPCCLYTDELSLAEIREIYANQKYPADNIKGLWKMTEGSGSTIADSSGNGNNLDIVGGATWSAVDLPVVARTGIVARQGVTVARQSVT